MDEFSCSNTGRKVDDPELLEEIRLTIINNLLQYHPVYMIRKFILSTRVFVWLNYANSSLQNSNFQESSAQLAMGAAFGVTPPKQEVAYL